MTNRSYITVMPQAIIYLRCSTNSQANSLDIQERMALRFCERFGYEVVSIHREVASGKDNERPVFLECVANALRDNCVLVATKIDRLARRISAIGSLIDSGVRLRIVALGDQEVSKMVLAVFSAMAEQERDFISMRTKEALAHLKGQGVQLGNPRIAEARALAIKSRQAKSAAFRTSMSPVLSELQATGLKTLQELADALNRRGYKTPRGCKFRPTSVRRLLVA